VILSRNKTLRQVGGMLETANLLLLKLWLKNPSMVRSFPGEMFRTYMALAREERWTCKSIFEVLDCKEAVRITLDHIPSTVIETRLEQLACLALATKFMEPHAIFEIGTFRGRTALNFALNAPEDGKVYTMDLPPEGRSEAMRGTNVADARIIEESDTGCEYRGKDVAHKIEQIYADSQSFDFTPFHGRMDMVYVDGAHHYEAVRSDTRNALAMVRPGGLVLWDEFANYGDYNDVTRAILDCIPASEVVQVENTQLAIYRKPG
jgi:predicted O-methyltransferase YrrM